MTDFIYDSKNIKCKSPFGAVKCGENISFNIQIKTDEIIKCIKFIYKDDSKDEIHKIDMNKCEYLPPYQCYNCSLSFNMRGLYFYSFEIHTQNSVLDVGKFNEKAKVSPSLDWWQLTVYDASFKTPSWAKGAIMYQIFPDRFNKSDSYLPDEVKGRKKHTNWYDVPDFIYDNPNYKANDYYMGNIDGIIEKLGYIKSLGVNIIYLNPIFESSEYHRYSTGNYFNVDSYFGTNDKFKKLCLECKKKNIKIILDGVFSHTGADSIYFNKYSNYDSVGAYNSKSSPYYNWYSFINYPDKYESWWGFENLPNVNETTKDYLEYITGKNGVIKFWQNLGAYGWRLDVADELPDEFLDELYKSSKSNKEDSFIIGEVWEDATNKFAYSKRRRYLLGGQMDSVMNYPWRSAILEFVKFGNSKKFNENIFTILENYPPDVVNCLINSISTHDTIRAITYFGVDKNIDGKEQGTYIMTQAEYQKGKEMLLMATFLQFTLPGIACIYYGDEVGLSGFKDPYSRMTYPHGREDVEILDFFRKMAKIRNDYKSDFLSPLEVVQCINSLYAFKRGNIVCIINSGEKEEKMQINHKKIIYQNKDIQISDHFLKISGNTMLILKKD